MLTMRNKAIGFVFATLMLWATVTYLVIFYESTDTDEDKRTQLTLQIDKLEEELNLLIASNEKLIQELQLKYANKNDNFKTAFTDYVTGKETILDKSQDSIIKSNNDQGKNVILPLTHNSNITQQQDSRKDKVGDSKVNVELINGQPVIAVLVISCNRVTVRRCLDQLIKFRPSSEQFPIIVSQDCNHSQTSQVIESYGQKIIHIQQPDQSDIDVPPREKKFKGYFKIARHYGWALNQIFFKFGFNAAIIVEDDLDVAPDFFEYFLGTHPILMSDPTLFCVSAWNDNGKADLVDPRSPDLLYRTDFFPGLGWMLTKKLWEELSQKWPKSYWDDWIRQPEQRKNRACIRPELSRTRTFGKIGVSNGLFYEKHLQFIKLNENFVPFSRMNLTHLIKENYDLSFVNQVYKSEVITYADLKKGKFNSPGSVRIPYHTRQTYKTTAKMLGLMDDFKSGVPRTGYRGIVSFFYNQQRVYLAPSASWSGYDLSWS
ncbi:alpha-1,3-mannosyl-glycoprotein 2-beta-N-acetylglucosaminyltransferase [Nasonia vitripennis]|uniref:Alpha-1,3-mannosyl-glycoprotein 2-beta-N-acetylglucosaminyltransferase n=1 Tax=Nasonia vitripennis TaxID=7425 RepID=A0A7M7HAW6_NASVI|nr:alpha-1,3-mannosyl-glycoprotein 2-beta-N-acetylglucosaminyltransferase [Nasonia vitripennis]